MSYYCVNRGVSGCLYIRYSVGSGVLQGTVLGPILNSLFINDVEDILKVTQCNVTYMRIQCFRPLPSDNAVENMTTFGISLGR